MAKIRTCYSCKQPTLFPVSRELQIIYSVYHYECKNCGETTKVVPTASIGTGLTVGALALAFWGSILFSGPGNLGWITITIYVAAALSLAAVWVPPILTHTQCPPVSGATEIQEQDTRNRAHLFAWPIKLLEGLGFLGGLLAPILFIVVVLGAAALFGYINFTYFR